MASRKQSVGARLRAKLEQPCIAASAVDQQHEQDILRTQLSLLGAGIDERRLAAVVDGDVQRRSLQDSLTELLPLSRGARFIVVHRPFVVVRDTPDVGSTLLRHKMPGDVVESTGEEVDGWVRLAREDGWMLEHGGQVGLGLLLRRLPGEITLDALSEAQREFPMVVSASDGLCNRLRVALSFALVARRRQRRLIVVWPRNKECAFGAFEDAFEPIDAVDFCDRPPPDVRRMHRTPCVHRVTTRVASNFTSVLLGRSSRSSLRRATTFTRR